MIKVISILTQEAFRKNTLRSETSKIYSHFICSNFFLSIFNFPNLIKQCLDNIENLQNQEILKNSCTFLIEFLERFPRQIPDEIFLIFEERTQRLDLNTIEQVGIFQLLDRWKITPKYQEVKKNQKEQQEIPVENIDFDLSYFSLLFIYLFINLFIYLFIYMFFLEIKLKLFNIRLSRDFTYSNT